MRDRLIELLYQFKNLSIADLDESELADYTSGGEVKELIVRRVNIEEYGFDIVLFTIGEEVNGYWCNEDRIGKNVFLTKEEAEQALKGGAER